MGSFFMVIGIIMLYIFSLLLLITLVTKKSLKKVFIGLITSLGFWVLGFGLSQGIYSMYHFDNLCLAFAGLGLIYFLISIPLSLVLLIIKRKTKIPFLIPLGVLIFFSSIFLRPLDFETPTQSLETNTIVDSIDTTVNNTLDDDSVDNIWENVLDQDESEEERKEKEEKDALELFKEIKEAYDTNVLVAEDTYKNNRYTLIGTVQKITNDGLFNTLFDTTTLHVTITIPEHKMHYGIKVEFDKDGKKIRISKKSNEKID